MVTDATLTSTPASSAPLSSTPASLEGAIAARRLRHLSEIGLALSAERDIRRLLMMILSASRELTTSDGGTLYIVEKSPGGEKNLFFRASQNDSITVDTSMSFAVSTSSLAGYAAMKGEIMRFDDVYHLDESKDYKFNRKFDDDHGYRTKSVLIVPLKDHNSEVIGVLQLINRKRRREILLRDAETVESEVVPFDDEMLELAETLASQAAVALNNTLLLQEIEELFEALVVAASSAIEDRDPSTSGHSRRVTSLTLALAQAVNETDEGPFREAYFSPAQMKELRYAALLHDFGKIGVRENVLVKSHKIEPARFEAVQNRILALRGQWQNDAARAQLAILRDSTLPDTAKNAAIDAIENETNGRVVQLDTDLKTVTALNDPTMDPLPNDAWEEALRTLERLLQLNYTTPDGDVLPVLQPDEHLALQVRRGTLTQDEFRQIQDHAQMSYEFLKQIPWTTPLEKVPIIARSHHERSDGSGYPQGLTAAEIPTGAKLMAIADVYDALTASDRPYKRAMAPERAIQILGFEAKAGKIDPDALKIFVEKGIWKLAGE
ncbi:GAF domain-containing protein [bacterium]|nr:MAG: GAF domain-containing protein [bacterium]